MSHELVEIVKDIYSRTISAISPATVLENVLHVASDGSITVGEWTYHDTNQPVYIIAIGKAAVQMTATVEEILGDRFADGLVVTKTYQDHGGLQSRVLQSSHPVPDERSLEAGAEVLRFASDIPENALVLCLISGGGSALLESLRPGVTLDNLQDITRQLLRAGASIHELNAVRARLSNVKAGGLLRQMQHVELVNLIISDVLGDNLATIASGPTVPPVGNESAEAILERYGVKAMLPDADSPHTYDSPRTLVVSNLTAAIDAASEAAHEHGLEPVVLSRCLTGEARHVATTLAGIVADTSAGATSLPGGSCILAGGETTVTVRGDGRGGRNTEGALAAAIRVQGLEGIAMGFLATDGDDAETGAAGGIISGDTVTHANLKQALHELEQNNSCTFLESVGAAWSPGATGTNVNDLVIAVVRGSEST